MTHNRTYLKDIKGIELLFIVQMYPFKKFKFLSWIVLYRLQKGGELIVEFVPFR